MLTDKSSVQIYSLDDHASKTIYETQGIMLGIHSEAGSPQFKIVGKEWQKGIEPNIENIFDWAADQLINPTPTPTL